MLKGVNDPRSATTQVPAVCGEGQWSLCYAGGGVNYAQTHMSILDLEVTEQPGDTIWTDDAKVVNSRVAMVAFPLLAIATGIA